MFSWLNRYADMPLGVLSPLLEILIIAALVFFMISVVRGTRIARGLALVVGSLLLILFVVSQWLRLDNVLWLIENSAGILVIGLIVIFQPEIRHGLVRLGETVNFWNARESSLDREIADAAMAIARKGEVGGLIVIERETQISSYIESGIQLDAICSAPLLRTIFTKNTPLHDGAAIIRQGRIVAANCLLPLSENVEVTRGMGTRHRAALGMAEESDAVTVVVSEETRQISVTMHGEILRDIDYERLRTLLKENVYRKSADNGEE
ncbi:MAG: diadenylate cyclase CdaA [Planctomycetota bacterium]|nr:diadenylate cyclase CdaA [Planctomycetota bacterium]